MLAGPTETEPVWGSNKKETRELRLFAKAISRMGPTPTASAQVIVLVNQTFRVLTGGAQVNDVTLTGTARRIAGSDDETGTAVLKALATGEARVDLSFPSGQRSETRANSDKGPVGNWIGPDGTPHPIAQHNLLADGFWFFPALLLRRLNSSQDLVFSNLGTAAHDGNDVDHLSVYERFTASPLPARAVTLLQHVSQIDLYIDPSSLLPSSVCFSVHPDHDARRDLPAEIRFSDYRLVNGVQVPFHVQKYVNNGLILDLHFDTAVLNSGLSAGSFNLQ
jgi:hypothetical protein